MTDGNFPSLVGIERAQAEDWIWATATFTWATLRLRKVDAGVTARPSERLLKARGNSADAIRELLADWQPPHRAN
jgi:hypothetical protein